MTRATGGSRCRVGGVGAGSGSGRRVKPPGPRLNRRSRAAREDRPRGGVRPRSRRSGGSVRHRRGFGGSQHVLPVLATWDGVDSVWPPFAFLVRFVRGEEHGRVDDLVVSNDNDEGLIDDLAEEQDPIAVVNQLGDDVVRLDSLVSGDTWTSAEWMARAAIFDGTSRPSRGSLCGANRSPAWRPPRRIPGSKGRPLGTECAWRSWPSFGRPGRCCRSLPACHFPCIHGHLDQACDRSWRPPVDELSTDSRPGVVQRAKLALVSRFGNAAEWWREHRSRTFIARLLSGRGAPSALRIAVMIG